MAAALWVAPSDDDELLAIEAFAFEPSSPARLVPCVGALGNNALQPVLAGQPVERRPTSAAELSPEGDLREISPSARDTHPTAHSTEWRGLFAALVMVRIAGPQSFCDKLLAGSLEYAD